MKVIVYTERGPIERFRAYRKSYVWFAGFSETSSQGGIMFPLMTRSECRKDALSQGAKAAFVLR